MYSAHMSEFTKESLQKYLGKHVNIHTAAYGTYANERIITIDDNKVITEYHHFLKTPEDGLLREHWIDISAIDSVTVL
jgi:hypothetical protein